MRSVCHPGTFITRAALFGRLDRALAERHAIVTLTGPAGIGKTRTALEYVHVRMWSGQPVLIDLRQATSLAGLCNVVSRALGAAPPVGDEPSLIEQVGRAIATVRPPIIVLDNFEHLARFVAVIEQWSATAPGTPFVVTSRHHLGCAGEVVMEVPPLTIPMDVSELESSEAGALLLDRVRRSRGDAAITDHESRLLVDIARKLEGVPLALELAASRLTRLGIAAVHARSHSLDVLVRIGSNDSSPHRSLRRAIDLSWTLLEPSEQRALVQLTLFRAGFTLEHAAHVIDVADGESTEAVCDVVDSLVQKSLIRTVRTPSGDVEFSLYSSVREYAAERFASLPNRAAMERRFARFVLQEADRLNAAPRSAQLFARLLLHADDLFAVVDRALAFAPESDDAPQSPAPIVQPGPSEETSELASIALRALAALRPAVAAQGPADQYLQRLDRAIVWAHAIGAHPVELAHAMTARGLFRRRRGEHDRALADFATAMSQARVLGDAVLEGRTSTFIGFSSMMQNRPSEGVEWCSRAVALLAASRATADEAVARSNLGCSLMMTGRAADAMRSYVRALDLQRESADPVAQCTTLTNLGFLCLEQGRLDDAARYFDPAVAIDSEYSVAWPGAFARYGAALTLHLSDRVDDVEAQYRGASLRLAEAGDVRFEALCTARYGVFLLATSRYDDAYAEFHRARALFRSCGDHHQLALTRAYEAVLERRLGRPDLARVLWDELVVPPTTAADGLEPAAAMYALCLLARAFGFDVPDHHAETFGEFELARTVDAQLANRVIVSLNASTAGMSDVCLRAGRAAPAPRQVLRVHADGHWFELPSGERVNCESRRSMRVLLTVLAHERARTPGRPVPRDELVRAVWAGPRVRRASEQNRLRVLLTRLRKLGLEQYIKSPRGGGCLLDTEIDIEIVECEPSVGAPVGDSVRLHSDS